MRCYPIPMAKRWILSAFIFFFLASFLGLIIRYGFVVSFILPFKHLLHTHSHIAILSWLFMLISGIYIYLFNICHRWLSFLWWIQVLSAILMLVGFLYQSYGAISITGASLHIFGAYGFIYVAFSNKEIKRSLLVKISLIFYLVSSCFIWAIPPSIILYGRDSRVFRLSIEIFLHFQIYGWLITAYLGILYKVFGLYISKSWLRVYALSVVLSLGLTFFHFTGFSIFYCINALAAVMQLSFGLIFLSKFFFKKTIPFFTKVSPLLWFLYLIGYLFSLIPKVSLHLLENRGLVLFSLHWIMLGVISLGANAVLLYLKNVNPKPFLQRSWLAFILSFFLTELLLFVQAFPFLFPNFFVQHLYLLLFICSIPLFISVCFICYYTILYNNKN